MIAGKVGEYIKLLMRRALGKSALSVAGALLSFFTAYQVGLEKLTSKGVGTLVVAALLILGVALLLAARKHYDAYSRAAIGLRSERRVADELSKSGAAAIIHGALLSDKGGDADHIVLGPPCVVVETKTGRGQVRVNKDGFFVGSRKVPGNPVRQASRQAQTLSRKIGVKASAIVCVVDMTGQPFQVDGTWVCSLKDLRNVLARCPRVLAKHEAHRLVRTLVPS